MTSAAQRSTPPAPGSAAAEWWRSAVIYQVYPRSFADADGDGIGDLPGITRRLGALAELGVDAIWLSPFFRSPQRDAGYDVSDYRDIDPLFGTLADFDALLEEAHRLGLRVIADIVPNHTSDQHAWFQAALAAGPGSPERARYLFRDGRGAGGDEAPNNWQSIFGGPAWTRVTEADGAPGQWYLHLFDSTQPDLDWTDPEVLEEFDAVLRFWLDRGIDGFRVDVAHGLAKAEGLPDWTPPAAGGSMGGGTEARPPYFGQEGVHAIWRRWRAITDAYPGERVLAAEAWVEPLRLMAQWVRPDEFHQAFNFGYLEAGWSAEVQRRVIDESLAAFGAVGAPSTWVLSNHDVVRHATRLAIAFENPQGDGIGPRSAPRPDPVLGLRRARAATLLMLALPGGAYLYQGEELGLPEAIDLPDDARQDPTWFRTAGERYGRDGCRVPLPWEASAPAYGFNRSGASWLPQPAEWAGLARDEQRGRAGSTLELYRAALAARRAHALGLGELHWLDGFGDDVLAFGNGALTVLANLGDDAVPLPPGLRPLLLSEGDPAVLEALAPDTTVWLLG